jgi:hypothetical protein
MNIIYKVRKLMCEQKTTNMNIAKYIYIITFILLISIPFILNFDAKEIPIAGGCDQHASPYIKYRNQGQNLISYCENKDADRFRISSKSFTKPDTLNITYSGYPESNGIFAYLASDDGIKKEIRLKNVGERWTTVSIDPSIIPSSGNVQIIFEDNSNASFGWIGLSDVKINYKIGTSSYFKILILIGALFITCLILMSSMVARFDQLYGSMVSIIIIGMAGYGAFFIFLFDKNIGIAFSALIIVLLVYLAIDKKIHIHLNPTACILLPSTIYTLFVITITFFPFNQLESIASIAESRWLNLPFDNWLPKILADQVWKGDIHHPMIGDWLSSDRPPLQSGINLIVYPFSCSDITYQTISSYLQALFFVPVIALALRWGKGFTISLIISIAFSSLSALHTVFVWPKIIAASYTLMFFIACCTDILKDENRKRVLLIAFSIPLAMLSHGGCIFALLGISIVALLKSKKNFVVDILKASPLIVLLYSPWYYYQHNIDPPGDRLLKWHLAGIEAVNDRPFVKTLEESYSSITLSNWFNAKLANFDKIFSGTMEFIKDIYHTLTLSDQTVDNLNASTLIGKSFFTFFYSYWFLSPLISLLVFLIFSISYRRVPRAPSDIVYMGLTALISAFVSVLLLFQPSATVIHQNSFYTWYGFYIFSFSLLWFTHKTICVVLTSGNVFLFSSLYVYDYIWKDSTPLLYVSVSTFMLILFIGGTLSAINSASNYNKHLSTPNGQYKIP